MAIFTVPAMAGSLGDIFDGGAVLIRRTREFDTNGIE